MTIPRISKKRLAALGGRVPSSSITGARKPVKKSNTKRQKAEFVRCYESTARCEWIKAQPSVASGKGPCENVHTKTGGAGRKADACWIIPLTREEHRELHTIGNADRVTGDVADIMEEIRLHETDLIAELDELRGKLRRIRDVFP